MTKSDAMLRVLRDAYPKALSIQEIKDRMGIDAPKSLGALRTLLFRTRNTLEEEWNKIDPNQTDLSPRRERLVSVGRRYALVSG